MPDSASMICCTSAAGMVTGDIAPIRMNGVEYDGLVGGGVLELRLEHPVVPAQWRVAVDQRDQRRRLLDRLARPEQDLGHRDGVGGVDARDDVAHVELVGQRLQRVDHVEVAAVERGVVGLGDHAAGGVERRRSSGRAARSCGSPPSCPRGVRRPRARTAARRRRRTPSSRRRCARCWRGCGPGGRTPAAPWRPARARSRGRGRPSCPRPSGPPGGTARARGRP